MRGIRVLRDRHRIPGPGNLAIITSASKGRIAGGLAATVGVIAGSSLSAAADAVEELEATAKLFLLLRNEKVRCLTPAQVAQLRKKHPV